MTSDDSHARLSRLLEDPKPGFEQSLRIEVITRALASASTTEDRERAFTDLCRLAVSAYEGSDGSSESMVGNAAAPTLLRFFLLACARFLDDPGAHASPKTGPDTNLTNKRNAHLARAFGLSTPRASPQPKPHERVDEARQMAVCVAYSARRHAAVDAMGKPLRNAEELALEAAFEVRYDRRFDRTKDKRLMGELRELMAEHGYI